MQNPPLVTIVIANNNYGDYINDAITSALEQSYPNINLVIVDDCSTDDSWQKIHELIFKKSQHSKDTQKLFEKKECNISRSNYNTKITAFRLNQQLGPSEARNLAIEYSINITDYYAILDADDYYYKDKIIELINVAIQSEQIGVVYGDYDIYNVDTKVKNREYKEPYSLRRLQQECIVHSGALIKASVLTEVKENTGYYDANLRCAEDYDLWLRISEKYIIIHVPKSLSLVRTHQNNSTNSVKKEIWERCWNMVAQKFKERNNV